MCYQRGILFMTVSAWNSAPIAAPWRQSVFGVVTAFVVLAVLWLPAISPRQDPKPEAPPAPQKDPALSAFKMASVPSHMAAFAVARPQTPANPAKSLIVPPAPPQTAVSPVGIRMADGEAFPLVITIPAGPAWRDVFRTYGGAIGVSDSSSARPAYLSHTISPDGRLNEESVPTIGRFLFRLSDEAIRVVNETVEPDARITPGQSAFGVFAAPFRSVVARVLQDFCASEHVSPDDLALVQLELGPGFGLRVASTTRRAKKS